MSEGNPVIDIPLSAIKPFPLPSRHADVTKYAQMFQRGKRPPPLWVRRARQGDRFEYELIDGVHRHAAAQLAGLRTITCRVCN